MRIVLLSMPWAIFYRPSIQLGALAGYLAKHLPEVRVDCLYPYLSVAKDIGFAEYRKISAGPWAGETLYSGLLWPEHAKQAKKLFCRELPEMGQRFSSLSNRLHEHGENLVIDHDFSDCELAGFSVCFSQLTASLYAAAQIKKKYPDLPIIFGGSTCTPALGASLAEVFSQVNYVLTGEGEQPLAGLIRYLQGRGPLPANIIKRSSSGKADGCPLPKGMEIKDVNSLPVPRYDSYFREMSRLGLSFIPELPVEFSRGCWWNRCSFCNLNRQWCGYRFKNHQKVNTEIRELASRHQCLDFFFTDNALPPKEARKFFQETGNKPPSYRFFAEIRVPETAREWQIYRQGGLRVIQVGIEALSEPLLKRMQKGTTVLDNIYAMKLALTFDIILEGNLILEFPGSTEEDVRQTLRVLDAVMPYRPLAAAAFFLGDGSPVHNRPHEYGIRAVTVHPNNRLLFPRKIMKKLALPVKGYRGDRMHQRRQWQPVRQAIAAWTAFHARRKNSRHLPLEMRDGGDFLIIRQERPNLPVLHHRLRGMSRAIYLACGQPIAKKELRQRFKTIKEAQLTDFTGDLCAKQLMYENGDHYLALAVEAKT